MRCKVLLFFILLISTSSWAEKSSTKDCLKNGKLGMKSWEVIKYCGKPPKVSFSQKMPAKATTYQTYQYPITEAICYTMPKQVNVICDTAEKGYVKFYFGNDILKQIKIRDKVVNDVFLKFNQKFVLGDKTKHLFTLWGKPAITTQEVLKIPTMIEHWQYEHVSFTITDGVVTAKTVTPS